MIYWKLFITFVQIGLLSFGGGYASLPLIEDLVVHQEQWLTIEEYGHLITISQMTPGPIAINSATFIGTKIAGFPGGLLATLGCILPSIIIVTILAIIYNRYRKLDLIQNTLTILKPVVTALITASGVSIFVNAVWGAESIQWLAPNWLMIAIFIAAFGILIRKKANPILIMLAAGMVHLAYQWLVGIS